MSKYSIALILACLVCVASAQTTYIVTNTSDSGIGSLRQAILDAEASPGADIIDMSGITGTIILSTDLPNITEDLTINGNGSANTIIDGNNLYRPFFIGGDMENSTEAPVVLFDNLTIQNGYAEGESPNGNAGGGAGMGGGIFINNGDVTITNATFSGNAVQGGVGGNDHFGGGRMGGDGPFADTGGAEASLAIGFVGGTGGYGAGGGGGIYNFNFGGANGGAGGYGAGGGGGGGHQSAFGSGGSAGSFGGNGATANSLGSAGGGGGAGLGGAIFVRNGTLVLETTTFDSNSATGGAGGNASPEPAGGGGQGRGGAIFNAGGTVTATFFTFTGNTTSTASPDTHGTITFITDVAITAEPMSQLDIDEGSDASFSVTATGTISTYQWQVDDGNGFVDIIDDGTYSGSNTTTLDLTCVPRALQNFQYRVQIEGTLNDVTSQVASLTVTNAPDLVATIASNDLVLQCDGESLSFTSTFQNVNTTAAYQWLVNGVPVQDETSDTFSGGVAEGDEVSLELSEPSSCYPRPVIISNILTVQRIKVDTVVISNTLTGRNDVGSLPYHLAQTASLTCNDIITVMDLRQLPQGSIISMDQALFTQSPVHIIGNGSDETIIRATTMVSTVLLGRFNKLEGFKLENTNDFDQRGINVFADSLVMSDVIITGFNSLSRKVLEYSNDGVDNNPSDYYVNIDSVQIYGGRQIGINIDGNVGLSDVTGTIKIVNSVFKNAVHHNIFFDFGEVNYDEVLIQGNLFQDNDLAAMLAFFNDGVAGGTFTVEQNSVINQYREVFDFDAEPGLDIDVVVRNNTFSETGVRGFADFTGDYPVVILDDVDADIVNNTMVGVQDVLSIGSDNQVVFANNLVLDEENGVTIRNNSTPDFTNSGNNIGIDLGDNNDLTSTNLEVLQSLTLTDPGGKGLLVYEPVECGPAAEFGNSDLAPQFDQIGRFRFDAGIGAVETLIDVVDLEVSVTASNLFPGSVTFTPDPSPAPNPPTITYTYQWFLNDVATSTDEVFNATNLVAGDEVQVAVTSSFDFCRRPNPFMSEVLTIREAITLGTTNLSESLEIGEVASQILADTDLSVAPVFSLTSGAGDTDNASFSIQGTELLVASELDFETKSSLSIRLNISDGGNSFDRTFQLTITDVNDAPIFTSSPTMMLERDDDFDYDITTVDDEGSFVSVEGLTIPDWLTFNINPPAPETVLVTTEQTGIPQNVRDFVVDATGNFYYTDRFDDAIYKMDVNGVQTVIADANSASPIFSPAGIDIGPDGTIYVAVVSGGPEFDGGIYTIVNDVLTFLIEVEEVQEVAVANDNLFYALSRSKLYKIENGVATVIAGTDNRSVTDGPVGIGQFANPAAIDVAPDGTVWVRDTNRVRFITGDGSITTIVPDASNSDFVSSSGNDLLVDVSGNVYFDNFNIIGVIPVGTSNFKLFIGSGGNSVDGDQNTARWGRLAGLYSEPSGNIWTLGYSANTNSIPQEIRKIVLPPSTFSLNGNASIIGEFPVSLRASDGMATSNQDFTLEVRGPLNFEADPVTAAVEGAQYIYNPSAIHSQSTAFTYGFTLPDWLDTSLPFVPTSFLNISSGVPNIAPFSGADATVTNEAVYTIQGSTISGIRFDGSMDITIDFSSLNPIASFDGPVITSNENGELYFAFNVADPSFGDQDKLIKVDPNVTPVSFTDLGTFQNITDLDIYDNKVIILEERIDNSMLVGDISIVDDTGMVTSVISGSSAEGLNVGLDGKIYFVGGSNFQPEDHSEFIAELELNGTFTTRDIFAEEEVYSVQDLVVDAFGNAYVHYEGLDENQNIFDSYFYRSSGTGGFSVFTAPNDIGTFEITGFTRYGTTNDIFYIYNNIATGTSDLMAYADNQIIFGIPGSTDGGPNSVTITLDDQSEVVTQTFTINVPFDNEPPTGINISGNGIDENNATGSSLLTFTTTDPNSAFDVFTYELISGSGDDNNAEFAIINDGLQANQSYDFESNPGSKSFRVRSTDLGGESVEETFTITINDINEIPTAIALSGNAEVEENLEVGTVVGVLSATDEDAGDTHTYSVAGIGSDLFQIVGDELQTAAVLDFEQAMSYTLTVTTEDLGQLSFDEDFTITIIDDNPTDITLSNSSVDEGLLQGAVVGTLMTTDTDPNNTFTYAFVSGTNFNAFFEIDGDVLKTRGIFDAAQFSSATIRVSTTDEIGESFEKDLIITINDLVNSAPQLLNSPASTATQGQFFTFGPGGFDFDGDNLTYMSSGSDWLIQQDQPATVEELLAQNGANDLVIDEDDNLYITINDGNGTATNILKYDDDTETTSTLLGTDATSISFVDVDENGVVYFSDNNFQGSSFQLKKIDNGTVSNVYFGTGDITAGGYHSDGYMVLVESQGDNTRDIIRVDLDGTNKTILEEEVGYISVLEIGADDNIHYTTSNEMSAIDISGNAATSIQPQLSTDNQNSPFLYYITDFVQYSETEAYIMYADNDNAGGSLDYLVKVTSSGEQLLWSGNVIYEGGKIAANAGNEVYFARDTDSDGSNSVAVWNNAFTFFFGTPGDEHVGPSNFDLNVSDGTLSNDYSFVIDVQNVNDDPTGINLSSTSIDENSATGTVVGTITATDLDNDSGDTHTYVLVSGEGDTDNENFEIVGSDLKTQASFDHESEGTRSVRIKATDASNSTFEQTLSLSITDLNESPTAIQLSISTINENEVSGTTIGTLSTEDPDAINENLVFEIIEGSEYVQLSGAELQSAASFDFETTSSFTVKIKAADGEENTATFFTIEETFTITVGDVSESPSDITLSNSTVAENSASGTVVGSLAALDPDGSSTVTYSLAESAEDNASFNIVDDQLLTAAVFNFEVEANYTVELQVSDGNGNTYSEKFTISVTDVSEAPVFNTESEIDVAENATLVSSLTASDEDADDELTYSIVDGADKDLFTLAGQDLSFASAPNFESSEDVDSDNVYEVTVRASDGTNETDLSLIVSVTDMSEAPVFITSNEATVSENTTLVAMLEATDEDADAVLTYNIVDGFDQDMFTLSEQTLSFATAPDFELPVDSDVDNVYEVNVQVTDGTHVSQLALLVTVTNIDESPILTTNTSLTIVENTTTPVILSAEPAVADATLTYSIIDGVDRAAFSISGNEISFVNTPDFEAPADLDGDNVYEITLRISDDLNEVDSDFTITVTNENEAPNSINLSSASVNENEDVGTLVGTLTSTDADANFTHTYSLMDSESNFIISGNELRTSQVFDVELQSSFEVTVTVTDEGSLTFNRDFTITVNEAVEDKPNSTIVINTIDDLEAGSASFELSAVTEPEDAVVIWSVVEGDATIDGTTLIPGTQSGLVVVKAAIEETDSYNGSEDTEGFSLTDPTLVDPIVTVTLPREAAVIETVTVNVSFDAQGATTIDESDVVLGIESGPGTLNGNQLTFTGAGTVVVSASLAATTESNAVYVSDDMEVFQVYNVTGRALDADGNGFTNGAAFLVASDNFNETLSTFLGADGSFSFENVKEGDYYLGIGVPQSETTYLSTYLGDKSPVLNPTDFPDVMKLTSDVSGLVINMQSKPAPAVDLIDPAAGGKIEFQAQGAPDGQNRIILGRVEMGDPIPNTQVVLSTVGGDYIADGLTDEAGFITFEGLPTGDYKIGVEIPGVGRVETEIPVEEGEQADVTGLISEDGTVALEVEEVLNVDLEAKKALTIYPNPVVDQLNLSLENDYRGELTFSIYDLNGRLVLRFIEEKKTMQFEITKHLEVPEGTYMILITGKELNLQQRFIKR